MSDLVAFGGGAGLPSRENLAKNLATSAQSLPSSNGGAQFLKMDKGNGDWIFGQEETVVEEGSLWAINPLSLMHGWVAWDSDAGGAPVEEIMVSINRPLPDVNSLPELPPSKSGKRLDYQQQRSVQIVCVSGEDKGTTCEYKQSSVGAMKLFGKITNDLLDQLDKDPDNIVAIVTLGSDRYKHKKYGWIYNPEWAVQEWRSMGDTSAPGAKEEVEEPKKAARSTAPKNDETRAYTREEIDAAAAGASDEQDDADEEARLAAEYEAEQKKATEGEGAPRRRLRR